MMDKQLKLENDNKMKKLQEKEEKIKKVGFEKFKRKNSFGLFKLCKILILKRFE